MAYPKEQEHQEYLKYVEQWSNGEDENSDKPKMSKEEWRKKRVPTESKGRRSIILAGD